MLSSSSTEDIVITSSEGDDSAPEIGFSEEVRMDFWAETGIELFARAGIDFFVEADALRFLRDTVMGETLGTGAWGVISSRAVDFRFLRD